MAELVHDGAADDSETELETDSEGADEGDFGLGLALCTVDVVVLGLEDTVDRDVSDGSQNGLIMPCYVKEVHRHYHVSKMSDPLVLIEEYSF